MLFDIEVNNDDIEIIIKSFNVFDYIKRKFTKLGYALNEDKYILMPLHYGSGAGKKQINFTGHQKLL
ncbi:hypothetical protein ACEQPO_29890 [Bacillus sp. SL00103]